MSKKNKGKFSKKKVADSRTRLKTALLIVGLLLVAAICALLFLMNRDGELLSDGETTMPDPVTSVTEDTTVGSMAQEETMPPFTLIDLDKTEPSETTVPGDTTDPVETTKPNNQGDTSNTKPTQPPATEPPTTQPPATQPPETQPPATQPPETQPPATQPPATRPPETQPPKTVIHLPYTIPGTSLTIQRVASYDGLYLEDGSDAQVSGVAMIMLTNVGRQAVEYARITLTYDDKVLTFELSGLKAGAVVAVQEAKRSGCAFGDLIDCSADVAVLDELGMADEYVSVTDNGNNTLTVKNLTDKELVTVRIFYKYYMEDQKAYVGGITYTAKISNLKAGDSIVINPSHYASGACEVVMVRVYDTDA